MKLEHKKEQVATWSSFVKRIGKYSIFAGSLIFISVVIGTVGYRNIGHLTWIDSFHMACMILTGMGPVVLLETDAAKLFSSFYALYSGIAFLTVTALFLTPIFHRLFHILHIDSKD